MRSSSIPGSGLKESSAIWASTSSTHWPCSAAHACLIACWICRLIRCDKSALVALQPDTSSSVIAFAGKCHHDSVSESTLLISRCWKLFLIRSSSKILTKKCEPVLASLHQQPVSRLHHPSRGAQPVIQQHAGRRLSSQRQCYQLRSAIHLR